MVLLNEFEFIVSVECSIFSVKMIIKVILSGCSFFLVVFLFEDLYRELLPAFSEWLA